jgi:lysophospholipid acyltransferase (LPLAT)-like uncharacterized protein
MAAKRDFVDRLKWRLVGVLGKAVVDMICATMRIKVVGFEAVRDIVESRRFLLAFWHSRIVLVSYLFRGWGGAILVSASRDGEIMSRILQRQGHETVRGSSSRHGVRALARLIKLLNEENRPGAVVPDGPQGPRFQVQPGVITLAQKTGRAIVPISYSAKRVKIFGSWDRFLLPFPFCEATIIYGKPVFVRGELDQEMREHYRLRLEQELNGITNTVDRSYGHVIG